jgi:hypothetical protein
MKDRIKVISWKEIFDFFKSEVSKNSTSNFLVQQFCKLLEVDGMGPIRFTDEDFEAFEMPGDQESANLLRKSQENLLKIANKLVKESGLKNFQVARRQFDSEYVGVEINEFSNKKYSEVLHYSLGMDREGILIYVIIEPKALVGRFINARKHDPATFDSEFNQTLSDLPVVRKWIEPTTRIEEKWFFIMGNAFRHRDTQIPIDGDLNLSALLTKRLVHLLEDKSRRKQIGEYHSNRDYRARSVFGTLAIQYCFPPEFVATLDENAIISCLREGLLGLAKPYSFLRKILHRD